MTKPARGRNLEACAPTKPPAEPTQETRRLGEVLAAHQRVVLGFGLFALVLTLGLWQASTNRQLELFAGLAEDYVRLGVNLEQTGRYHRYPEDLETPFTFRPPGYPAFVAGLIRVRSWISADAPPGRSETSANATEWPRQLNAIKKPLITSQVVVLSLSSVVLFLWLGSFVRPVVAAMLAATFGCNAYTLALSGFLHYDSLHLGLIIMSCYLLQRAIKAERRMAIWLVVAGVSWGVATLVRPMTLLLPPFVLLLLFASRRDVSKRFHKQLAEQWKPVLLGTAAFVLGMAATIGPWTVRNYTETGQFIPVNSQAGTVFWASTVRPLERHPNHFRWWQIWFEDGMPIFTEVTGDEKYSYATWVKHNRVLDTVYRQRALENILNRPTTYVGNVIGNTYTALFDINTALVKFYQAADKLEPTNSDIARWLTVGHPQDFYSSTGADTFKMLYSALMILAGIGLVSSWMRKDRAALVPLLIGACFLTAHGLTYMDTFYYYSKLPVLFLFAACGVRSLERRQVRIPGLTPIVSMDLVVMVFLTLLVILLDVVAL